MTFPTAWLIQGDARSIPLAEGSVQCVVTSPPYWGLRDYGVVHQLGLERTPEEYVAHLVEVFREVRRVLRDDGTCWLNLGDSYAGSGMTGGTDSKDGGAARLARMFHGNRRDTVPGLKPKDLVGIPWRVAFALQADGWWLRSDIIWSKPNPMPESITDRPTKAHEYLFLLTKSARYFYDSEAIKEKTDSIQGPRPFGGAGNGKQNLDRNDYLYQGDSGFRNRRSVWTIATQPYPESHFAVFPEALVEPCILAGTSERGACPTCGAPWGREVERATRFEGGSGRAGRSADDANAAGKWRNGGEAGNVNLKLGPVVDSQTTGWVKDRACSCQPADPVPCRVFDPFAGSGTTVAVAERLGRVGIGLDLKAEYLTLARRRTVQAGLL